MNPEVVKRLDELGAKLEVTGKYLWKAAVEAEYASAIGILLAAILSLTAFIIVCAWIRKSEHRSGEAEEGHPAYILPLIFTLVITANSVGMAATSAIPKLIAPEGAALRTLLGK